MKHFLVVVDIQKDFVDGALGTKEALSIIPAQVRYIDQFNGQIFATFDTHSEDYLETAEGKKLPVRHCIRATDGWKLNDDIAGILDQKGYTPVEKGTFGSVMLPKQILQAAGEDDFDVTLIGLCTDICVVSNALLLKAHFPEKEISVIADCCAGVSPETHLAALATMRCCQINVL